jgi:hypothetical protein
MRALVAGAFIVALFPAVCLGPSPSGLTANSPLIYSERADDSWNRIFAALFTRTVKVRYASDFAERGPFQDAPLIFSMYPAPPRRGVSTRVFDHPEDGDRAVDALYPTFLNLSGPSDALVNPLRAELVSALNAALNDRTPRTPLARALMQADLWSAYDPLARIQYARGSIDGALRAAAYELCDLIGRLIGRIALTGAEISALPDNYADARSTAALPDLFRPGGEWLEVIWAPFHMHDQEADYRRVARVLMRPVSPPRDVPTFLAAATREYPPRSFAQVALVMQTMLVDSTGHVVASPLAQDVQLRTFTRSADGTLLSTSVSEIELSRRKLLASPSSGGSEAYVPVGGNDYGFATPSPGMPHTTQPTISTLHIRCNGCHGPDGAHLMSFAVQDPNRLPPPRALPQPNDERRAAVVREKEARDDFKRLIAFAGLR